MRNLFATLRQMLATITTTMRAMAKSVYEYGRWVIETSWEIVKIPMRIACQILNPFLTALNAPGSSKNSDAASQARNETAERTRAAQAGSDRDRVVYDLARLVQRTAIFRARGHENWVELAAELPDPLRHWLSKLSTDECARLAALDTRAVAEHLEQRRAILPGLRSLSDMQSEAAYGEFHSAPSSRIASDEHTDAEYAVLKALAERLKLREPVRIPRPRGSE